MWTFNGDNAIGTRWGRRRNHPISSCKSFPCGIDIPVCRSCRSKIAFRLSPSLPHSTGHKQKNQQGHCGFFKMIYESAQGLAEKCIWGWSVVDFAEQGSWRCVHGNKEWCFSKACLVGMFIGHSCTVHEFHPCSVAWSDISLCGGKKYYERLVLRIIICAGEQSQIMIQ